jgi:hypothetical protein
VQMDPGFFALVQCACVAHAIRHDCVQYAFIMYVAQHSRMCVHVHQNESHQLFDSSSHVRHTMSATKFCDGPAALQRSIRCSSVVHWICRYSDSSAALAAYRCHCRQCCCELSAAIKRLVAAVAIWTLSAVSSYRQCSCLRSC